MEFNIETLKQIISQIEIKVDPKNTFICVEFDRKLSDLIESYCKICNVKFSTNDNNYFIKTYKYNYNVFRDKNVVKFVKLKIENSFDIEF